MDQEKFGNLIKKIRKDNNLTQKEFADKYNVTYQAVSKWENGKNMPDSLLVKKICDDFNLKIEDLCNDFDIHFVAANNLEEDNENIRISEKIIEIKIFD